MSKPVNPIKAMRGDRPLNEFVFDVNSKLGYAAVSIFQVSRLESADHQKAHKVRPSSLAPFAQYDNRPVKELMAEYQSWLTAAESTENEEKI